MLKKWGTVVEDSLLQQMMVYNALGVCFTNHDVVSVASGSKSSHMKIPDSQQDGEPNNNGQSMQENQLQNSKVTLSLKLDLMTRHLDTKENEENNSDVLE